MRFGTTELLIILVVVILIFGPTQLPKLAKMIGSSVKKLRSGLSGGEEKPEDGKEDSDRK